MLMPIKCSRWGNCDWAPFMDVRHRRHARLKVRVKKFNDQVKVPQIGWNQASRLEGPLFKGIDDLEFFYFVHSYAVAVSDPTIATSTHVDDFAAVIARENFAATQFHPERSAQSGAQVLANFLEWQP